MKRTAILLVVVALAGFAAGQAVEKVKFPWVAEKDRARLNAPCGKTELEWRCATAKIGEPTDFNGRFMLSGFDATPLPDGLLVKANVTWKKGLPGKSDQQNLQRILSDASDLEIPKLLAQRICPVDKQFRNLEIHLFLEGRLVAKQNVDGFALAK